VGRVRLLPVVALLACVFGAVTGASAQTRTLIVHMTSAGASGDVRVLSGAGGPVATCHSSGGSCVAYVNQGALVEVVADFPGRLSAGTGPAAACMLSTCSFAMTADADVSATFTSGDGPAATVTTTVTGGGLVWSDGRACQVGSCAVQYFTGSTVHLAAGGLGTARFTGYSLSTGDAWPCTAGANCAFTLNTDSGVSATFAALTSFTVTPSSASAVIGGPAQTFTATGTYSTGPSAAIASTLGAWSAAPSLPSVQESGAAAAASGKVYALGGVLVPDALNTVVAFDPGTQTWTTRTSMLSARGELAAAEANGLLYAIGGRTGVSHSNSFFLSSVERYDPATNSWTPRASMQTARAGLVAASVNGVVYAAGGSVDSSLTATAALEAYDPATDFWSVKAPMPAARSYATGGVVDGILYVVGGYGQVAVDSTDPLVTPDVQAYNPATNSWSFKASLPIPLARAASAVADGVLYVFNDQLAFAYDPVADAWSVKAPLRTPRTHLLAASLNGVVYAIGGVGGTTGTEVETFVDGLRWSSSAPSVARIAQTGAATPRAAGTATIVAHVGATTCAPNCPVLTVTTATQLSLDVPANNSTISSGSSFDIGGWAINRGAVTGTGVDTVHIYAQAAGGSPVFLGAAYGTARPDIGALYGSQFTNSGFLLQNQSLSAGTYTITAYARNAMTGTFDASAAATITVTASASNPAISVDTPTPGQTVTSAFEVFGWALDLGATTGTGADSVQFYVQPQGQAAPGVFVGTGTYGFARPDLAAIYGSRFTNVGFHFTITGLSPGSFTLNVYARSTVTGSYSIVKSVPIAVSATALMSIDAPSPEATFAGSTFLVGGWSIDRSVESTAQSGSGVDTLHVYAYPNPGSGQPPIFLGVATVGVSRPDVGAAYGSRYDTSGYQLLVDRAALGLAPGLYGIVVHSHSAVSGTFNNDAVVWVTLQ